MTENELDEALAALPRPSPAADFADRVMARVALPEPIVAYRPAPAVRRPSVAVAASSAVVITGAMVASVLWTMSHQTTLVAFGQWLMAMAGAWAWHELQAITVSTIAWANSAALHGIRQRASFLTAIAALGPLVYMGGLVALRRLMTGPTQRVAHVEG